MTAQLFIYDQIGFGGLSANEFRSQLNSLGEVDTIDVHINSSGGDVFDGITIGALLKQHPAVINIKIDGLAASIASLIAMVGDHITIADNGMIMIHEAHSGLVGDADKMRKEADLLDKINALLISEYAKRTGKTEEDITQLMSDETWFNAQEALDIGLVDEISEPLAVAACAGIKKLNFKNVPECYREILNTESIDKETADKQEEIMVETKETPAVDENEVQRLVAEQVKQHKVLMTDIRAECKKLNLDEHADELCDTCETLDDARKELIDLASASQSKLSSISFGLSQQDKQTDAIASALNNRVVASLGISSDKQKTLAGEMAAGWEDFKYASLWDLGKSCLEMDGINTRGLTRDAIAMASLGFYERAGIRADAAYHTPSSFPQLMLDAANKSLLAGYEEAPSTWQLVFRQASSVADFKNIHRIRLSEIPNVDEWPDNTVPNEVELSDQKESYAVKSYSNKLSFSYRTLINDDMDALSRAPQLFGNAFKRTVNAVAWSQITANGNMQDGTALFHADHNNFTDSGAAPNIAGLNVGKALIRKQTGIGGSTLALIPKFLVVPAELEGTALGLVNSQFDPGANLNQVFNPHSNLVPVIEPLLDASSTVIWYLMADPSQTDTVEVTFLQGEETPQMRSERDFDTMAQKLIMWQSFNAKVIDHRGLYRNDGA